jgi:hypothetical protein
MELCMIKRLGDLIGNSCRQTVAIMLGAGMLLAGGLAFPYYSSVPDQALEPVDELESALPIPPDSSVVISSHKFREPAPTDSAAQDETAPLSEPSSVTGMASKTEEGSPSTPTPSDRDEVNRYLWTVYRRSTAKWDSHGDFTWKDAAAAERMGISVQEYVIGGMDPDFREQLFHAGSAMDAAGLNWTILSAFRDDYRQSLAVGLKAQVGNSFHGGSIATGGYGHGCAVDLASTDGLTNAAVWNWLDQHGGQFGLHRPLHQIDPAHVQPYGAWHELAAMLRHDRLASADRDSSGSTGDELAPPLSSASPRTAQDAGVTPEQFNCVRPRPAVDTPAAELMNHLKRLVAALPSLHREKNEPKSHEKNEGRAREKNEPKSHEKTAKNESAKGKSAGRIALRHESPRRPAEDAKHTKGKGPSHIAGLAQGTI